MAIPEAVFPDLGQVEYIQSFLPTGDHIRSNSALEIKVSADIGSGKLGVIQCDVACETCDCFLEECAGHHGHMEMPIPIFRVFFVKRLISVLNCICVYCGAVRIPKSDPLYKLIDSVPKESKLDFVLSHCSQFSKCGNLGGVGKGSFTKKSENIKVGCCGMNFINFATEDRDNLFLSGVIELCDEQYQAYQQCRQSWKPFVCSPQYLFRRLKYLPEETKSKLGLDKWTEPSALMWDVIPVPSHNTRPSHTFAGIGSLKKKVHSDWTKFLKCILSCRNELQKVVDTCDDVISLCKYSYKGVVSRDFENCFIYGVMNSDDKKVFLNNVKKSEKIIGGLEGAWRNLTKQVAAFHSYRHRKYQNQGMMYGKPLTNVEERFKHQKCGRLRGNIIARRVNNAMRAVLEGGIEQKVDEAMLPKQEAMVLTVKVYVNNLNLQDVQKWVINGPYIYPGANYVTMKSGVEINLNYHENRRDIDISEIFFVCRHLIDGDVVMVNRQPTLHKPSMMAFRAIITEGYAIRLHYAVFPPMGADCDGDEVNVHVPQSIQSKVECLELASVQSCIMKDGKILIKFIQNSVIGAFLLTADRVLLQEEDVHELTSHLDLWEYPLPTYRKPDRWSGKQIFSLMLPGDFSMLYRQNKKEPVEIRKGVLVRGQLNDGVLNGTGGILNHLFRDYADKEVVMKFLYEGYIMFQRYIDRVGVSAGYFDTCIDPVHWEPRGSRATNNVMESIRQARGSVLKVSEYVNTRFRQHNPQYGDPAIEENIKRHIEKVNQLMCKAVVDYHKHIQRGSSNGVLAAIESGSKGTLNVINQMCGLVSQVYVLYKRPYVPSTYHHEKDCALEKFGYISRAYSTGIDIKGMIAEAGATCESIINKNKGTSKSGYTVRKMTNCMMGVVVDYLGRVVDSSGRVLWQVYGNDGYDSKYMCTVPFGEGQWSESFLLQFFTCEEAELENAVDAEVWRVWSRGSDTAHRMRAEVDHLLSITKSVCCAAGGSPPKAIRIPFSFEHIFFNCIHLHETRSDHKVGMIPSDYYRFATAFWRQLLKDKLVVPTNLHLKYLLFHWFSARVSLVKYRLELVHLVWISKQIHAALAQSLIAPGESVGVNATQSLGEPFTQLTLKTPHLSGKFPTLLAGSSRVNHIIDGNFSSASMNLYLKHPCSSERIHSEMFGLGITKLCMKDIMTEFPTYELHPNECHITFAVCKDKAVARLVSLRNVVLFISDQFGIPLEFFRCSFADEPEWYLQLQIPFASDVWQDVYKNFVEVTHQIQNQYVAAAYIMYNLYEGQISGFAEIDNFIVDQNPDTNEWFITTLGSCLKEVMLKHFDQLDTSRCTSSDCSEMNTLFGTITARKSIEKEILQVMSGLADVRHVQLLARVMTSTGSILGMKIKQSGRFIPPLQKAAFEQGPKQMTFYCQNGDRDHANTICGAALSNKIMGVGTGFGHKLLPIPKQNIPEGMVRHTEAKTMCEYVFSPKVDGRRVYLCFNENKFKNKLCSVVDRNFSVYPLQCTGIVFDSVFKGTILDGDLCPVPGTDKYCLVVYDCVLVSGNKCACLRYDQRLEIAREVVTRLVTHNLSVPVTAVDSVDVDLGGSSPFCLPISTRRFVSSHLVKIRALPFYLCVKPVFNVNGITSFHEHHLPRFAFPTDGYVFSKLSAPATPFRMHRTHLFKWKPNEGTVSENTIDLEIGPVNSTLLLNTTASTPFRVLQVVAGERCYAGLVKTRGDAREVWTLLRADHELTEGQVYECGWHYLQKEWVVLRTRYKQPNTLETVVSTVRNIEDNIQVHEFVI